MGERSKLDGCHRRCWNTGSQLFHAPGCVNATEGERAEAVRAILATPTKSSYRPRLSPYGGPAAYCETDAERAWARGLRSDRFLASPSEQCMRSLVYGEPVSAQRLTWAHAHARRDSVVKELLAVRMRKELGLAAGAPLEREAAHA